jgi:hypothetical protein
MEGRVIKFMHVFEPSSQYARCDACEAEFDPVFGGACRSCQRLLCSVHFYGRSRFQRLRNYLGFEVKCVDCRAGNPIPPVRRDVEQPNRR